MSRVSQYSSIPERKNQSKEDDCIVEEDGDDVAC